MRPLALNTTSPEVISTPVTSATHAGENASMKRVITSSYTCDSTVFNVPGSLPVMMRPWWSVTFVASTLRRLREPESASALAPGPYMAFQDSEHSRAGTSFKMSSEM